MPTGRPVEFVRLTGRPAAVAGGSEVPFAPDKRFQLLAYLAYAGSWVGRERVAYLFWPDSDTSTSRQNLRALLQRLGSLPFQVGLEATKHQLKWEVPTDVAAFAAAQSRGDLAAALTGYHGPLLQELGGDGEDEFDGWLEIEREQLYSRWRSLALRRLGELAPEGEDEASDLVRRLLEADHLDEEVVRAYMRALVRWGKALAAVRAYREFAARLEREMGMEPTSETVLAYEEAQAAEPVELASVAVSTEARPAGEVAPQQPGPAAEPSRAFNRLPVPGTSFVGRETELEEVATLLRDPGCRLLSLTGPGGIGKTRLALAAAERLAGDVADAAVHVPLEAVDSPEEVLPAIAAALGIGRAGGGELWDAVQRVVSSESLLVVIDNFEHVLGASELLPKLLTGGQGVKLLVTTRERLGLEAEWTYLVGGLSCPPDDAPLGSFEGFGAAKLLVERARRVRPDFRLTDDDLPHLRRLFAVTRGMPLAIELVAAWLRAVPLGTLVDELELHPGDLAAPHADAPTKHESVRAVFEQSWSRLTDVERQVLRRLAVFAGPMTPEAAAYVAGANRLVLGALVDKSLVRLRRDGRYDRHPLLRGLAREKLAEDPGEEQAAVLRHAAFYLHFLRERSDRAKGPRPALVLRELQAEAAEMRAAMRRAAETGLDDQLVAFMELLELESGYFQAHGHDDETLDLLSKAADAAVRIGALDVGRDLRGRVGDVHGLHRGDPRRALVEYEAAGELARRSGDVGREAVFLSLAGVMRRAISPGAGQQELDRALELASGSGDPVALSIVYEHRAFVLASEEQLEEAREFYLRSLQTVEDVVDPESVHPFELTRRRYFATLNLGHIDLRLGRFDDALDARHAALRLAQEAGNQIWEAFARLELGEMYAGVGRRREAIEHLKAARALYVANHVSAYMKKIENLVEQHGFDLGG